MPSKTLLLVFIHGFQGDDDTFSGFPAHLRALLSNAFPNLTIKELLYPAFETRGDLDSCVSNFCEWLVNKTIDLEVELGTASPTVEPGVRTIIVGHSMGGIVGAEALRRITGDENVAPKDPTEVSEGNTTLMFPYIQGLLAFDTPYLGIAPGVVAHGAEGHLKTGMQLYEGVTGLFGGGKASKVGGNAVTGSAEAVTAAKPAALPAPDASQSWTQRWGKTALIASAATAVSAAAATTAYWNKDQITSFTSTGYSWATSHLEFVGCLARGAELEKRVQDIIKIRESHGVGFANLYTCLGRAAQNPSGQKNWTEGVVSGDRTFCNLPRGDVKEFFHKTVNDKAPDEVQAHMWMFVPKYNPNYYTMSEYAKEIVQSWVDIAWSSKTSG